MDGKFENLKLQQGIQAISILPFSVSPPLPLFDDGNKSKLNLCPLYSSGWDSYIRADRIVTFSKWDKVIDAVTEITTEGVINAAGYRISAVSSQFLSKIAPEGVLVIPSVAFEKDIIEAVFRYLKALRVLGATGPWFIGIALLNVNKSLLYVGAGYAFDGRIFEGESIYSPIIEISSNLETDDPQFVARALRPAFDYVWREHNYPYSLNYGETGDWVGH